MSQISVFNDLNHGCPFCGDLNVRVVQKSLKMLLYTDLNPGAQVRKIIVVFPLQQALRRVGDGG